MKPPVPATAIGNNSARRRGGMRKGEALFVSATGDGDRASVPGLGNNLARPGGGKECGEAIVVSSTGDGDGKSATGIGNNSAGRRGGMEKGEAFFVSAAGDGDRASVPSLGNKLPRPGGGKDRGEAIVVSSVGDGDRATTTDIGNYRARPSRGIKREEAIFVSAAADDSTLADGNRASEASSLDRFPSVVLPKDSIGPGSGNLGPVAPAGGISIVKCITHGDRALAQTAVGANGSTNTSPEAYITHRDKDLALDCGNLGFVSPVRGLSIGKGSANPPPNNNKTHEDSVLTPTDVGADMPRTEKQVLDDTVHLSNVCFNKRNFREAMHLMDNLCAQFNSNSVAHSMRAKIYRSVGFEMESKAKKLKYLLDASHSAGRASTIAPSSIHFLHSYASLMYDIANVSGDTDDYSKVVMICDKWLEMPKKSIIDPSTNGVTNTHVSRLTLPQSFIAFYLHSLEYMRDNANYCSQRRLSGDPLMSSYTPSSYSYSRGKRTHCSLAPKERIIRSLSAMKSGCSNLFHVYSFEVQDLRRKIHSSDSLSLEALSVVKAGGPMRGWPCCFCVFSPFASVSNFVDHIISDHVGKLSWHLRGMLPKKLSSDEFQLWTVFEEQSCLNQREKSSIMKKIRKITNLLLKEELLTLSHKEFLTELSGDANSLSLLSETNLQKVLDFLIDMQDTNQNLQTNTKTETTTTHMLHPDLCEFMFVEGGTLFVDMLKVDPDLTLKGDHKRIWKELIYETMKSVDHLQGEFNLLTRLAEEKEIHSNSLNKVRDFCSLLSYVESGLRDPLIELEGIFERTQLGPISIAVQLAEEKRRNIKTMICRCDIKLLWTSRIMKKEREKLRSSSPYDYQQALLCLVGSFF